MIIIMIKVIIIIIVEASVAWCSKSAQFVEDLLSLLNISEGESLQSPMNPLRQLTFTRGFPCHSNEAMQ